MAEKHERSGRAPKGLSQVKPLGDWPIINLILTDETGSVDYGYNPSALMSQQDDSASVGDPVEGNRTRTFEFHTKLTLDKKTLDDIRVELLKGTEDGRRAAYGILKKSTQFETGGSAGKKMIKAALQARFYE